MKEKTKQPDKLCNIMPKYLPYDTSDISTMINEPWEITDKPFMLHAAYALSCLYDLLTTDEEEFTPEDMWGQKIEKRLLDRLVMDLETDFNDAATNYKPIRIWGKGYSIRKVNSYDHNRLHMIFDFPLNEGEYTTTKEGVLNLASYTSETLKPYEVTKEQAQLNRTYLRQIIMLAEDDANDGWSQLTDMEVVIYCWALFYNKHQCNNFIQFKNEYKDHIEVKEREILGCLNEKSTLRQSPVGMYAFSFDRVMKWNAKHQQESFANKISSAEADDYWYEVALKDTFKPIDQR